MALVNFFSEDTSFKLAHPRKTAAWIKQVVKAENRTISNLNFIFCSADYLLETNQRFLKHDTDTDIITFEYSEAGSGIEGDIFISPERIMENSQKFSTRFDNELHRVIIHGVLHLMGYDDKTPKQKTRIRQKEDACLSLRSST